MAEIVKLLINNQEIYFIVSDDPRSIYMDLTNIRDIDLTYKEICGLRQAAMSCYNVDYGDIYKSLDEYNGSYRIIEILEKSLPYVDFEHGELIQRWMRALILKRDGKYYKKEAYPFYLRTNHWKEKRKTALNHADWKCQLCKSEKDLQVHHNTYDRLYEEKLSDLVVLCKQCHEKFHGKE